jgi:hypothetical protein
LRAGLQGDVTANAHRSATAEQFSGQKPETEKTIDALKEAFV